MNLGYYYKKLLKIKKRITLCEEEKKFLKFENKTLKKNLSKKKILVHVTEDYYCLIHTYYLLKLKKFKDYELVGLWTPGTLRVDGFLGIFGFILDVLTNYFILLKWKKLYKKIGLKKIYSLNNHILEDIQYLIFFWRSKKKFNTTNDILKMKYNSIKIGDLIYDTYIRFHKKYYYNAKYENNINKLLFITKKSIKNLKYILDKEKFIEFYIPQLSSAYIYYGLPIRYFLSKKVHVIGCDNSSQYMKKFSLKDNLSCLNINSIKKKFSKISHKNDKINYAKRMLFKKFKGSLEQMPYMHYSSYQLNIKKKLKENFNIIIFLPNFDDAQNYYGGMVFSDFYEWITKTLEFLKTKNNISVAIKEHPNQTYISSTLVELLKKKYKEFIWLNKFTNNKLIFKNKPKLGISVCGTVLHELAYHKLIALSSGNSPYKNYKFVFTPKSEGDYFKKINLAINEKLNLNRNFKEEIAEFYYMWYLNNNDDIENYSRILDLKKYKSKVNENNILILSHFNKGILNNNLDKYIRNNKIL